MTFSPKTRGKGAAAKFLRDHVAYDGDDCLLWPFGRQPTGYGTLGYLGEQYYAHRLMCEFVHGEPPTPQHEASHSCGRGKQGCVHPKHITWKTKSGNMLDKRRHGTSTKAWWGQRGKITPEQVQQIRDGIPYGPPLIHWLSAKFGITPSNIRHIQQGRTWKPGAKRPTEFTPQQLDDIRASSRSVAELAVAYGVSRPTIYRIRDGKTFKRPEDRIAA